MSALPDGGAALEADAAPEHYLVSHGKSGGVGSFAARMAQVLRRGDRVLVDGPRGREVGTVLCLANLRQPQVLRALASGTIVRPLAADDAGALESLRFQEERLFEAARDLARARALPIEILDADVLFDERAIVQFVGPSQTPLDDFAQALGQTFHLDVRLENLAVLETGPEPQHHGCGKPDCGQTGGGGCSTCSSGGGCSSCGSGGADLRPYFAHLRAQMEAKNRTPLL